MSEELGLVNQDSIPSYLRNVNPSQESGLETMRGYTKPARLKIIQSQAKAPYKPTFKDGDVIVQNMMLKVGDEQTPFTFIPIFSFSTWVNITPYNLGIRRPELPTIVEMTFDPNSELAKKAMKFINTDPYVYVDRDTGKKIIIDGWNAKYQHQLNFLVLLENVQAMRNQPVHFWFSGGEFKFGQQFLSQLLSRHSQFGARIFMNRFRAASKGRVGPKGNWFGYNIDNDPQPFIDEDKVPTYEKLYEELKKAAENKTLELDFEDEEPNIVDPANSKF